VVQGRTSAVESCGTQGFSNESRGALVTDQYTAAKDVYIRKTSRCKFVASRKAFPELTGHGEARDEKRFQRERMRHTYLNQTISIFHAQNAPRFYEARITAQELVEFKRMGCSVANWP
jgi:hypothetical protein